MRASVRGYLPRETVAPLVVDQAAFRSVPPQRREHSVYPSIYADDVVVLQGVLHQVTARTGGESAGAKPVYRST